MAHDKHRPSVLAGYLFHFPQAFLLKLGIAHGQHFIDNKDLRFKMGRNGESQANVHSARVTLDRRIKEFIDIGEGDDLIELLRISRGAMPRMAPLRKMFSRPVSSG